MAYFALDSGVGVRSGNSLRKLSTGVLPLMVLMLGISELAPWSGTESYVTSSSMRLCFAAHQEAKIGEEVDASDGMCDVGETPATACWLVCLPFVGCRLTTNQPVFFASAGGVAAWRLAVAVLM